LNFIFPNSVSSALRHGIELAHGGELAWREIEERERSDMRNLIAFTCNDFKE
jgi:hypothetical protein